MSSSRLGLRFEIERALDPGTAHRMGLPRDNRARLAMRSRRHRLHRLVAAAMHAEVQDAMRLPGSTTTDPGSTTRRRERIEGLYAATEAAATTTEAELAAEVEQLALRAAADHAALVAAATTTEAEVAAIHHTESRPAPPPGPELVALSLAPHAPPAEAYPHASPEGVT